MPIRPAWVNDELFPFESRFVEIDGALVHHIDEGEGPVFLGLHGNPTWSFLYRHIVQGLEGQFRCLALDYPGFGLSTAPAGYRYTVAEHARVVESFIERLGLSTAGSWHFREPEPCSEHGDDHDDDCAECHRHIRERTIVVEQDAEWDWTVEVQTWERRELADGATVTELVETDRWTIGWTQVNPCEVEYGPLRGSPDRAVLECEFWRSMAGQPASDVTGDGRRPANGSHIEQPPGSR
jgi:hypothetical protein